SRSFLVSPLMEESSSEEACLMAFTLPKCCKSLFFLVGPIPSSLSSSLLKSSWDLLLRWNVIATL
ncbi:MAG: hypothetical protein Q8L98_08105, partial [Chlamydiales bacterium]|nr:hypothetical protein [Chlamydiales bacterium]